MRILQDKKYLMVPFVLLFHPFIGQLESAEVFGQICFQNSETFIICIFSCFGTGQRGF